jgi:hypothetical protein
VAKHGSVGVFVLLDSPKLVSFPAWIDRETAWATSLNHLFLSHSAATICASQWGGTSTRSAVGRSVYSRRQASPSHTARPTDGLLDALSCHSGVPCNDRWPDNDCSSRLRHFPALPCKRFPPLSFSDCWS